MTDAMGGLNKFGMNFTPISSYNKFLGDSLNNSGMESANNSLSNFQNILDGKMAQSQDANPHKSIEGGVSMAVDAAGANFSNPNAMDYAYSHNPSNSASPVANTANNFSQAFSSGIDSLNQKQVDAQNAVETLASGGNISVHDVMIATQKSNLNMQMAVQLRNKMLTADNELYQMRF